jgi:hypothetical protein
MSTRPEIKVFFKAVDGSGYVDLCAFWRGDNGMLRGKLDRNVRAIKVVLADGSEKVLKTSDKGIVDSYYLNVRVESEGPAAPAKAGYTRAAPVTRGGASKAPVDMPADDFDEDDIPF